MIIEELIDIFVRNICDNYDIPANLRITKPFCKRNECYSYPTIFLDTHATSSFSVYENEVMASIKANKKDYRKLRSLIRLRLIDAIRQIKDLADNTLRNLGVEQYD